ncbi:sugar phosphate isomerase/epimerase [Chryseolinea sp. H1M3-3]|uniref:sugar phosphate isomerase/epimerase family protein n=1 Tax=Chryseolinea sp. H1M3-3 TaxID=3034144 RepID=UPI0023EBD65C|nr:sugar phosphate isomerase/epimerase [Chryseolinea sp. H1M3-3]
MTLAPFANKSKLFIILLLISPSLFGQQYGLQLYSLRNQFAKDAAGTMAKVKAMGFRDVEMAGTMGLPFPELIKLLAQNELNVVSFGADYEMLEKDPRKVAEEARAYGAKFIVCFWVPHQGDNFTTAEVDKAVAVFNNAAQIIASYGMLFCYHPHGYEFKPYHNATVFDYMMEKLDQRYVYLEMDVFWIKQAGQEPMDLLKKYSNRFVLLHLKDRKVGTPNTSNGHGDLESNVVLGTGDVGIAEIIREAKKLGIKYYFLEDESSKVEEQLPKSLAYLKSLQQ